MPRPRKYPEELLDRGVRLVFESGWPIAHVARDLGVTPEVLRKRVRRAEADNGSRPDLPTTAEREEIRTLRREGRTRRWFNDAGSARPAVGLSDEVCVVVVMRRRCRVAVAA